MSTINTNDPMLELYIHETMQILEQLEQLIISNESSGTFNEKAVNDIFRHMHTIKGSSSMMMFNGITMLAHKLEDIFFIIRENLNIVYSHSDLVDLVLDVSDFVKVEVVKIQNGDEPDGNPDPLNETLSAFLKEIKSNDAVKSDKLKQVEQKQQFYIPHVKESNDSFNYFYARIDFDDGCEMENVRAYTVVFGLNEKATEIHHIPTDIAENENTSEVIRENGFKLWIKSVESRDAIEEQLNTTFFLKRLQLEDIGIEEYTNSREEVPEPVIIESKQIKKPVIEAAEKKEDKELVKHLPSMISVHVEKLDQLMDLVGELVIAEAMVTRNPEAERIESISYQKASQQLHKITSELQDMVMSVRMVPLSGTFVKMHRIVRDMSKNLGKDVDLILSGEETEVDKNIIEHISDPLMHIIRNSIDHGIEARESREEAGKPARGQITLEARNVGSDVLIIIKDDGKGLNRKAILDKAKEQGILSKPEHEMTDHEIDHLILLPGFSTKEEVSEYSGRGVGMDVVAKNLEAVRGVVVVDSTPGHGTTMTLKIPLTLAIIEGMNLRVGEARYTIPLVNIKESFRPSVKECIKDPEGNEMVMIRGESFPVLRLHEMYKVPDAITNFDSGILIMIEQDDKALCLFADELLGQQQVVVKTLPEYITKTKAIVGLAGCTLLGDGSISLILDINSLTSLRLR
ncbi:MULTISPECIES: chemotaxis protein CheA [unclassified Fusibacter]|uniref:chemotaxis protein CheA n=1 Tax=unclassified Fusibacter TaxID=2624464 RepID=UPI0010119290|nr:MULTISPECIES: chemotaxis protein CheA [unclassified Fusibacter]MCK8060402.1 chemotaxis protein CheA [Fusibacter sp. A2]NPE20309.1 chemotaxis protein CheA [Fusibacter sp. A1]RXV63515.1 chemotaxis protein CheA [Fusibacter sp. A1]